MEPTRIALFAVLLLSACACQASGEDPGGAGDVALASSTPPAPTEVLAKVNGHEILARDLEETVTVFLRGQDTAAFSGQQMVELRKQLLDSLVSSELLYQESQKAGIEVSEEQVDQQVDSMRTRFPDPGQFETYVKSQAISLEMMKERIRRNLATEQLVSGEVGQDFQASEQDVAQYYEENKQRMRKDESVHLHQFFLKVDKGTAPDVKAAIQARADSTWADLNSGKDFAAVARESSESPDAAEGGDMGFVGRRAILPALADVAFALETGETSDIVETPFGLHILKVSEKRPAGEVTLEEARGQITKLLVQVKEQSAFDAYVERLKVGAEIDIPNANP